MPIEDRGDAHVIIHALAKHTLSDLRSVDTEQVEFRKGLVKLGRICGYEIINGMMETEFVSITTPLADTTGMDDDGEFPISVDYVKLPDIGPEETVIVADPMLATGSTMVSVLQEVLSNGTPERLLCLSAVSAPPGLVHVAEEVPEADVLTVAIDERLDDDGYIVPGLGDAGDRAFRTN